MDSNLDDQRRAANAIADPAERKTALGNLGLDATGSPLASLAGLGEHGCSICHRAGHRKGSVRCLGNNDPRCGSEQEGVPVPSPSELGIGAASSHSFQTADEEAAYAAESTGDDDADPTATICQCEHEAHFGGDDHAAIHAYMKAPAGDQQALYVGPICNACATEHLSEYLIQGPAGAIVEPA